MAGILNLKKSTLLSKKVQSDKDAEAITKVDLVNLLDGVKNVGETVNEMFGVNSTHNLLHNRRYWSKVLRELRFMRKYSMVLEIALKAYRLQFRPDTIRTRRK